MRIEHLILKALIYNEEYTRKVLPFLKEEYFTSNSDRILFTNIKEFISLYNSNPTYEVLIIKLNASNVHENEYKEILDNLNYIQETKDENLKLDWLIDQSEKFCKDKAMYNALVDAIAIADGKDKHNDSGIIPKILSDALAVGFNFHCGHDFIENYEDRYDYYHRKEERIPCDLEYFNKITNGGLPKKSLTVFLSPPHSGKSLTMCHLASSYLTLGKNVLYITLEMAEEEIAKRIDANILNISMDDLLRINFSVYEEKIRKLKEKSVIGKLIIKEYPTGVGTTTHFRTLLNELNLKINFIPDIIIIDYLNICASSRIKSNGSVNSYTLIKSISEEVRGLAQEYNLPIITATQTVRAGTNSSDLDMTSVSESFALNATCDAMFGIINTEELRNLNQILIKQIKNRYRDLNRDNKFIIGINTMKMQLYNVESSAQEDICESGQELSETTQSKRNFGDFKF